MLWYMCLYDIFVNCNWVVTGGSTHLHTNNTQNNTNNNRTIQITTNEGKCGLCPIFASFTLAFALQLRKKHGKISVMVRKTSLRLGKTSVTVQKPQSEYSIHITKRPTHYKTFTNTQITNPHIHTHTHTHITKQYKTTTVQIKTKCIQEEQHNGEKKEYLVSNVVNPQVQHTIFNRTFTSLHQP